MTSVPVYSLAGEEKGRVNLLEWFSSPVRPDLIQKAVLAEQSRRIHPYGSDPLAGQRSSARYIGRRGAYHSMMNREMARLKRITNHGFLNMTARIVPEAVKGRKAHPPKAGKIWKLRINRKERLAALHNAIAAGFDRKTVMERGHKIEHVKHVPLVVADDLQSMSKTRELVAALGKLGLGEELERCSRKTIRPGTGKNRGRRYKSAKGPLIIVGEDNGILKVARNVPGLDAVRAKDLTVEALAPGTHPGRLTVWSRSALESME